MIKQKTIIMVWGQQGSGKSSTIKLTRHELTKKYINPTHSYTMPLPVGDINDLFTCNSHLIGLESMGDYLDVNLKQRLDDYIAVHHCDIIICACRIYNDVAGYVEGIAATNGYRLIKSTNYRAKFESQATQDLLNIKSAIQLVDLIDDLMNGLI